MTEDPYHRLLSSCPSRSQKTVGRRCATQQRGFRRLPRGCSTMLHPNWPPGFSYPLAGCSDEMVQSIHVEIQWQKFAKEDRLPKYGGVTGVVPAKCQGKLCLIKLNHCLYFVATSRVKLLWENVRSTLGRNGHRRNLPCRLLRLVALLKCRCQKVEGS